MQNNFDLKLLAQLDALIRERHVTRAAEKFDMSQPQMSATLAKLRKMLGDPLLVRGQDGMRPTRYALDLVDSIRPSLVALDRALASKPSFDPEKSEIVYRIAASSSLAQSCLPRLLENLSETAPGVQVAHRDIVFQMVDEWLGRAEVDIILGYWDVLNENHIATKLFEQELCVIAAAGSAPKRKMSMEQFCDRRHAVFAGEDGRLSTIDSIVERSLARDGKYRDVAVSVPSLLLVPEIVSRTDIIATVPTRLARRSARFFDITIFGPPFDVPDLNVSMVWHEMNQGDPAHRWMREQIRSAVREAYLDDIS